MRIRIKAGTREFLAELNDSLTAAAIAQALPIATKASRWGKEIYCTIPVQAGRDPQARAEMAVGELGYWPDGCAFCIFFGPTPASRGDQPVAVTPVNPIGKLIEPVDLKALDSVPTGCPVAIESAE